MEPNTGTAGPNASFDWRAEPRLLCLGTREALAAAAVVYLIVYLLWYAFRWGGPDLELTINDAAFIPLGIAAVVFAWGARSSLAWSGSRRAWGFLALGFAAYCVGDVLWFWLEIIVGGDVPSPSAADIGYLAFYPFLLAGMVSLRRERSPSPFRAALDLAIVIVGTGTAVWVLVVGPVAAATASDPTELLVALAYPVGDTVLLFALAAALMRRLTDTSRISLALLGFGLLLNVVADLAYARLALEESYESGGWIDVAYMVGWLAMALSGYAQSRWTTRAARALECAAPLRPISLLPYGAVVLVYGLLVGSTAEGSLDQRLLVLGAVTITGLVVIRQFVTARENAALLAERSSRRLEARFRALIQNASDLIVVTDAAGTITYVTPSTARLLLRAPETLVGMRLTTILAGEDAPVAESFVQSAMVRAGTSGPVEWRVPAADGQARFMDVTATNLLDDPSVEGLVVTMRDVTDRKLFEQQLEHQAFHDPLTGLANRALLTNRVEHALGRARRKPTKPAVIYFDLDDFKRVNDSQGHETGDRVLLEVACRLRATLREGDTAARLGGDEFAILLEDTTAVGDAIAVATRIEAAMTRPIELDDGTITLTGSMGIVRADDRGIRIVELLRDADIAMYAAKREARGGHRVFEPAMFSDTVQRVRLEEDLRRALDNDEFSLVFQPLVELGNRRMVGVEALIRWNHPRRGLIMPLTFIPLAEETGEIVRIGRWVIEEACRTVGAWNARLAEPLRANVNVSVRQVVPSFVDDVAAILDRTGFPVNLLVLELTESMLAANRAELVGVLAQLRVLGVRIAIDDFGTGYSSLSYLRDLPVDEIKIDRSFVEALTQRGDTRLVSTLIQLGRKLHLATIAEGIEQEEQVEQLRALGCELGQGFLTGHPASQDAIGERLRVAFAPPRSSSSRRARRARSA